MAALRGGEVGAGSLGPWGGVGLRVASLPPALEWEDPGCPRRAHCSGAHGLSSWR